MLLLMLLIYLKYPTPVSKTGFLGAVKNFATEPFFEPVEGFNASSDQRLSETGKYASELWRFGDSESQGELDWRIARFGRREQKLIRF
jgi:hypothetical protein